MSGYGAPSLVNVPRLNEMNAIQGIMSLLQHVDKGELKDLLDNEDQLNGIISDNEEVSCPVVFHSLPCFDNQTDFCKIRMANKFIFILSFFLWKNWNWVCPKILS